MPPLCPKDDALVLVRELWGRTARPAFGVAQVSGSDHHPDCLERVRYVRLAPSHAEDAGRHRQGGGLNPGRTTKQVGKMKITASYERNIVNLAVP
jgi:hypothetical protein